MKIAIHHRPNSYSEQWIKYCINHDIQYKIVDAYSNDIIRQLADCDAFMWHFHHNIYKDYLFAKQLIFVIERHLGKITYPNIDTCWHFDDKIGQKYLSDAIGNVLVPTHIFYTREDALMWIKQATFPKVFKLRSGASSTNVKLVKTPSEAKKITRRAFNSRFKLNMNFNPVSNRWIRYKNGEHSLGWIIKDLFSVFINKRIHQEERGYVFFQDFIPNNNYDIRVFIIGNRAVAAKRMNRENDFRASGSHVAIFDPKQIEIKYIKSAFDISEKLKTQSLAFDFLNDETNNPIITEISYCCGNKNYNPASGYWTKDLNWHKCDNINVCDWIIEDIIAQIK